MNKTLSVLIIGIVAALGLALLFTEVSITGMQFGGMPRMPSIPTPTIIPTAAPQRTVVPFAGLAGLIIQSDDAKKIMPETCPAGYGHPGGMPTLGAFKTSPGLMDGTIEGVSASGKTIDSGWIELCAKDKGLVTVILQDDCAGITHSPAVQEECPAGYGLIGKFQAGPGKEGCRQGMGNNAYVTSGKSIPSAMIGICAKGATPPKEGPLAPPAYRGKVILVDWIRDSEAKKGGMIKDANFIRGCRINTQGTPVSKIQQCGLCVPALYCPGISSEKHFGLSSCSTGKSWSEGTFLKFTTTQKSKGGSISAEGGELVHCYLRGTDANGNKVNRAVFDEFRHNHCAQTMSKGLPALEPGNYELWCEIRGDGKDAVKGFRLSTFILDFT